MNRSNVDSTGETLGEVLGFMRHLWAVDHGLQRVSKRMASDLGLTGPQRLSVRILGRFPGIPAGGLAAILHLHPSTVTGIVQRLERQGLVRRAADPSDSRRSLLYLTPKGVRVDVPAEGSVEALIQATLQRYSRRDLSAATRLIADLAATLDEAASAPARSATSRRPAARKVRVKASRPPAKQRAVA